jgi:hypothetical protein
MSQFTASRLKIERAKHHINDLHQRMLDFATDVHVLSIYHDAQQGCDVLQVRITKSLPLEFAAVIGDALHNLKSALDIAINSIIGDRLKSFDSYSRFPIRETREAVEAAVNGALIKKASKAVTSFIVDSVKPYRGGNDAIWALHNLNILDKHRLLLPVMQLQAILDIGAEDDRGCKVPIGTWLITKWRTAYYPCFGMSNVKITNQGKAALTIFFDNGLPMEGQSVLPTLLQLAELVTGVIDGIEEVFLAENELMDGGGHSS